MQNLSILRSSTGKNVCLGIYLRMNKKKQYSQADNNRKNSLLLIYLQSINSLTHVNLNKQKFRIYNKEWNNTRLSASKSRSIWFGKFSIDIVYAFVHRVLHEFLLHLISSDLNRQSIKVKQILHLIEPVQWQNLLHILTHC